MADLSVFRKITSRISSVLGFLSGNAPGSHFMSAVVLAGGSGARLGGVSKQLLELCGKKVVCYSLDAFENSEYTSEIILVVREDETDIMKDIVSSGGYSKVSKIAPG